MVGESLYTLSERGLEQSDLDTLTEEAFVEFEPQPAIPSEGGGSQGDPQPSEAPPPQ